MAPIRLGIIGLSATNLGSWAGAAHLPYLISPRGQAQYKIVALCNSSVESARSAIEKFQLPADTRAYGSPNDLAQDANVDFVVCSTCVDKHYETIKPSIAAGKAVFVEWPLASNISQVRELAELAGEQGVKSVIGLQGPTAPFIDTVQDILKCGRIGKVLSSEVRARGGTSDRDTMPESLRYFTNLEVGGNAITIGFGHLWEFLQHVLGDAQDIRSQCQLQRLEVGLVSSETGTVIETVKSDVPDIAFVTATLKGNGFIQEGASLLVNFRRGQPFPGEPHVTWTINGEHGEIKFTAEGGTTPRTIASMPIKIVVHDFATGRVEDIGWNWNSWQQQLPAAARGVAGLYDAYAREDTKAYSDFDHALKRHKHLEAML
ncbi:hypothetical protein BKA67DRAFT_534850 [Truncatella angustata]|uniref:Gfo/Idh/MocA-like oxidoreductase N-terminal domain-containing protein n=1 Tax=Truncatella angustata TaxID=152316 RepID=A0A9P8ZZD4_9PEZI|nr:uncharacterized protein BKA67DRAFT_534850 [Truncatella angustata]KAH6655943.1 hypothetical protein BKA67DRAFT_534850 [Truncatella angustata]